MVPGYGAEPRIHPMCCRGFGAAPRICSHFKLGAADGGGFVLFQYFVYIFKESVDLTSRETRIILGLQVCFDFLFRQRESVIRLYTLNKIGAASVLLDLRSAFNRVTANTLVQLLPVAAAFYRLHHNILACHIGHI